MDSAKWLNEKRRLKWLSMTVAVAALVGLSIAPVQAQEIYRFNTGTYLQEAITELRKPSPNYHKALDTIQAAVEELRAAIGTGELEEGLGTEWMDRLTAVAGQVAADRLDGTSRRLTVTNAKHFKRELAWGDGLRAAGEYREAIERYKHALPRAR